MINTVIVPHSVFDSHDSSNDDGDNHSSVMNIILWVLKEIVNNLNMDSNVDSSYDYCANNIIRLAIVIMIRRILMMKAIMIKSSMTTTPNELAERLYLYFLFFYCCSDTFKYISKWQLFIVALS